MTVVRGLRGVLASAVAGALVAATAREARADDPLTDERATHAALGRWLVEGGRVAARPADPEAFQLDLHGEYQLRYQGQRSFPLLPTASAIARSPGLTEQSLGQNQLVHHWLRLDPVLKLRDTVELVSQIDVVTGLVIGKPARDTHADETPRDARNGFSNIQPRWLYVQTKLPFGTFRIGQQPNHWGMGIFANDGNHPTLFGDYRYGQISERVLFVTKPGGKDSDFVLAVAGDLVFRDPYARLVDGQHAFQAVLAAYWEHEGDRLGLFSTLRHQETDRISGGPIHSYTDDLDSVSIDLHGRVVRDVPGMSARMFGEAEAVYVLGTTSAIRNAGQALGDAKTQIRAYGGAARVGVAHVAGRPEAKGNERAWGDVVGQVEIGYASGDADPYDGTHRRFTFDPNHRIGLLLFDEVLRFQTARSATAAADPLGVDARRPPPSVGLWPSNGGVYGAQYVNPTAIYRPRRWLDLKGGMVVAQATSDVVDPYRVDRSGAYVNHRGGDARNRDLGVELDVGVEARVPLQQRSSDGRMELAVGAQAGVLFPGRALDDADGRAMPTPFIAIGRLGLQF